MIKLTDILKEIEQDHIDEIGVKDIALGAMMAASTLGAAKSQPILKQPTTITQTVKDSIRTTTPVDGIIGSITSQFKFLSPEREETKVSSPTKGTPSVITKTKVPQTLDQIKQFIKTDLTIEQMKQWNDFVDWMKSKGISGDIKMDKEGVDKKVLEFYKDKVNPEFWINNEDDIKEIQKAHKDYRETTIKLWKAGKWVIVIDGKNMVPGIDDDKVDKNYLALAK
jgi:hypothetical protein